MPRKMQVEMRQSWRQIFLKVYNLQWIWESMACGPNPVPWLVLYGPQSNRKKTGLRVVIVAGWNVWFRQESVELIRKKLKTTLLEFPLAKKGKTFLCLLLCFFRRKLWKLPHISYAEFIFSKERLSHSWRQTVAVTLLSCQRMPASTVQPPWKDMAALVCGT